MSDFADPPCDPTNCGGQAIIGSDGRFRHANPALVGLLGYGLGGLKRLRFQDITHADDLLRDEAQVERLLEKGRRAYSILRRYFTPGAKTVWTELSVKFLRTRSGQATHFVGTIRSQGCSIAGIWMNN